MRYKCRSSTIGPNEFRGCEVEFSKNKVIVNYINMDGKNFCNVYMGVPVCLYDVEEKKWFDDDISMNV